jgi:hypothetical protein
MNAVCTALLDMSLCCWLNQCCCHPPRRNIFHARSFPKPSAEHCSSSQQRDNGLHYHADGCDTETQADFRMYADVTPIECAAAHGHAQVVKMLLQVRLPAAAVLLQCCCTGCQPLCTCFPGPCSGWP